MEWKRYLKAMMPAIGTLVGVGVQWGVTGEFDAGEWATAGGGALVTFLTYLVRNETDNPVVAMKESVVLHTDWKHA